MFGRFFRTAEVDQFADSIVAEVKRALPVALAPGVKNNIGARTDKLDAAVTKKTAEFTRSAKLNIYKKARLAARVREGMSSLGYPESFVKAFSIDLLHRLQAASKRESGQPAP